MRVTVGLGAYPDSVCYDPSRPGLLPYWFDDFQEEACKVNMLACGNTTCSNKNAAAEQKASGAVVIQPNPSTGTTSTDPGSNSALDVDNANPPLVNQDYSWVLWLAGGALLIGFLGGRR